MRFFILLGLCASCLCLSCSSTGESQGSDVDAAAEDTLQADSSNDLLLDDTLHPDTKPLDTIDPDLAQPDLFQPECTVDSDCADLVDSACLVGTCDEGNCVVSDAADGTVCDDGNGCTQTDACQAGVCTGGNPVVCPLPDPCHDTGVCDPATGICSNPAEVDGTPCDDGNEATGGDSCKAGLCLGEGCVCNTFGACCNGCFALNQGGACSDDNDCTQTDACQDGFCVGSNPVVCEALDQCHEAGTCAPATGLCSNPTKADSTFCDDGDGRTAVDKCLDGVCAGTPCTCDTIDTCCDGCLGINTGVKCWEGAQHGGLCTAEGVCHDPSRWAVVALTEIGISTIDTQNEVVYGPFLNGWLGSEGGGRFDVAVSPDGLTAVVSNFGDSTIHFVDLTDPTEPLPLGTVLMPMFAEDVAFTPDGKFVLVTDGGFSKYIVVVDAATRTVVETFVQNGVEANSVSVAPDGTVVVTDYFRGQVHSLRIDGQGHLTHVGSHTVYVNIEGDVSLEKGKHTIRPVNVFISPNGKTVLVSDVTKYNETPTLMDPVIDAGYAYYAMVVFEIVSPGVLEFKGEVKRVPAAAQSAAFSDDGKHAYILGNSMWYRGDVNEEFVQVEDHLVVLDIAQTGEVTLNPSVMPNLKRTIGSQLFGVDNIVVIKGKAYVTHSSLSGATKNVSVIP